MKHTVVEKQKSSHSCFVCGVDNGSGLHAEFFQLDNNELMAVFTPREEHQSYPGRTHGGVSAAMLDETIGRAITAFEPEVWGVTVELKLRYKKPVPLGVELKAIGRVTSNNRRIFEGSGEILLPDGTVAVTAEGRYMKLPIDKIAQGEYEMEEELFLVPRETDPTEVEL